MTSRPLLRILDRLPIADQPSLLILGIEPIAIKRYQIAVWVSINAARG
jgi:hypothetical protein